MKMSPIRFSTPLLDLCEFKVNTGFIKNNSNADKKKSTGIKMKLHTKTGYRELKEEKCSVFLMVEVGEKSAAAPFFAKVVMRATFSIKKDVPEEMKKKFITVNAPALLYSYIRPIIASLTGKSVFPQYNLPFMDFTQKKGNTQTDTE